MNTPTNMATDNFVNTVHTTIPSNMLRENKYVDLQIIRFSHHDWVGAQPETYQILNQIVKESDNLLSFKIQYVNSFKTWIEIHSIINGYFILFTFCRNSKNK